jgi:chemotaxis signal transduction protein
MTGHPTAPTAFVLFRLAEQTFATALDGVREIVRLDRLEPLPGTAAPMAGLLVLRGVPLPVFDVRPDSAADRGDVLVVDATEGPIGIAVDQVVSVLPAADLPAADAPVRALPPYVVGVRRGEAGPVLLVDLQRLLDVTRAGWTEALASDLAAEATG